MADTTPIVLGKAGKLHITIERYATFSLPLQFKEKAPPQDPLDFTGATFKMQIRENLKSETFIMELTTANGRIISTDLPNGKITFLLTPTETATLAKRGNVYDLLVTYPSAAVDRLLEGQVEVIDGVTHT
jgi:hypothetical protein